MVDILVFGAHPDDAEIACGGLLLLAQKERKRVAVVDLTAGEMGSRGTPEIRAREAREAAQMLGLAGRECLGLPDARLEERDVYRMKIIEAIRRHRPGMVVAPYPEDLHPDHAVAGRLVEQAAWLSGLTKLNDLPGKPHRPRSVIFYMFHYEFVPTFILDISPVWDKKIELIRKYRSQLHRAGGREPKTFISRPNFLEGVELRHRYYGNKIGARHGEPFWTREPFRVGGLGHLQVFLAPSKYANL
jgi:bacillithiol biosynthesis deacetylase BshB1